MLLCALILHPVWLSASCKDHSVYIQCGAFYINTTFVASLWLGGVPQITLKLHLSCVCLFGDVNTRSTINHWRATPTFVYAREKHTNTIQNATFTASITTIINCFLFGGFLFQSQEQLTVFDLMIERQTWKSGRPRCHPSNSLVLVASCLSTSAT